MPKQELIQVQNSSRGGYTYHVKTIKDGEVKYLEYLREDTFNHRLGLVCSNRWKKGKYRCDARWSIDLVGLETTEYKTPKDRTKNKINGSDEEIKNVDNYGKFLYHSHTKKCKGKKSFSLFFFQF